MRQSRSSHAATRLADGRVLVTGGCADDPCRSAEIYDPATNRWTPAATMTRGHVRHAAAALADGRVLVSGGTYFCDPEFGFCFTTDQAEIYSPATNQWTRTGKLIVARELHTATLLPDGRVLVTGGVSDTHVAAYDTTEIFTP
jgi:N-acetylneuraminic acid mutarotase